MRHKVTKIWQILRQCSRSERKTFKIVIKGSLSFRLCSEYFSLFKIDSEMYTYLAAVLKDSDVSKHVKLSIWKLFWSK